MESGLEPEGPEEGVFGVYSVYWMVKGIVHVADERLLRNAVMAVVDQINIWQHQKEAVDLNILLDLISQISVTGAYIPGDMDEIDRAVESFSQQLDSVVGFDVKRECDDPNCGNCNEEEK